SEINNDHFEVEKSIDNSSWIIVGKVKGHGTTNSVQSYQFTDASAPLNMTQTLFYRLKQVDFDGNFEYSSRISVTVNLNSIDGKNISIYPNPNNGNFVVENSLQQNSNVTFTIINLPGEKLWSNSFSLQKGKNATTINANFLSPGIYFLRMEDNSKEFVEVRKILVK
ncbi:MAG: T9SS type A sorting domain-containing protein, partial [Bacteroidia bacterium]